MKIHTNEFKNKIGELGRVLDSYLIYVNGEEEIELNGEDLNSITPTFKSNILKSAMKELIIDSNINIPVGSFLGYALGVFTGEEIEYINFGKYNVYSSEKQEDTNSYKITCYDDMLRAMTDYNGLQTFLYGIFPMTINQYMANLCNDLGLQFANAYQPFCNYNKVIETDLYKDLGYTYRDIFDEIAQVTASTICINDNNMVELRYITETNDVIDEEFFKDINVTFGKKYGPINSIVLSRSGESDTVYLQDENSIELNGLCELKISDNQIMNFNDRSDYLPDILNVLNGLEYYINDYSSTGICYYDICDRYTARIFGKDYSCVMFNDEINITTGLEENVFTDMPTETKTDYTKSDKTDRKINQAYIIVDKQNANIQSQVSKLNEDLQILQSSLVKQTETSIETWFNSSGIQESLTNLQNGLNENSEALLNYSTYIRQAVDTDETSEHYGEAYIELGASDNEVIVRIYPDIIYFLTNGERTAYISNNSLYIIEKQRLGHWETSIDNEGNINTYWVN